VSLVLELWLIPRAHTWTDFLAEENSGAIAHPVLEKGTKGGGRASRLNDFSALSRTIAEALIS
jgi:hypothetical protein